VPVQCQVVLHLVLELLVSQVRTSGDVLGLVESVRTPEQEAAVALQVWGTQLRAPE